MKGAESTGDLRLARMQPGRTRESIKTGKENSLRSQRMTACKGVSWVKPSVREMVQAQVATGKINNNINNNYNTYNINNIFKNVVSQDKRKKRKIESKKYFFKKDKMGPEIKRKRPKSRKPTKGKATGVGRDKKSSGKNKVFDTKREGAKASSRKKKKNVVKKLKKARSIGKLVEREDKKVLPKMNSGEKKKSKVKRKEGVGMLLRNHKSIPNLKGDYTKSTGKRKSKRIGSIFKDKREHQLHYYETTDRIRAQKESLIDKVKKLKFSELPKKSLRQKEKEKMKALKKFNISQSKEKVVRSKSKQKVFFILKKKPKDSEKVKETVTVREKSAKLKSERKVKTKRVPKKPSYRGTKKENYSKKMKKKIVPRKKERQVAQDSMKIEHKPVSQSPNFKIVFSKKLGKKQNFEKKRTIEEFFDQIDTNSLDHLWDRMSKQQMAGLLLKARDIFKKMKKPSRSEVKSTQSQKMNQIKIQKNKIKMMDFSKTKENSVQKQILSKETVDRFPNLLKKGSKNDFSKNKIELKEALTNLQPSKALSTEQDNKSSAITNPSALQNKVEFSEYNFCHEKGDKLILESNLEPKYALEQSLFKAQTPHDIECTSIKNLNIEFPVKSLPSSLAGESQQDSSKNIQLIEMMKGCSSRANEQSQLEQYTDHFRKQQVTEIELNENLARVRMFTNNSIDRHSTDNGRKQQEESLSLESSQLRQDFMKKVQRKQSIEKDFFDYNIYKERESQRESDPHCVQKIIERNSFGQNINCQTLSQDIQIEEVKGCEFKNEMMKSKHQKEREISREIRNSLTKTSFQAEETESNITKISVSLSLRQLTDTLKQNNKFLDRNAVRAKPKDRLYFKPEKLKELSQDSIQKSMMKESHIILQNSKIFHVTNKSKEKTNFIDSRSLLIDSHSIMQKDYSINDKSRLFSGIKKNMINKSVVIGDLPDKEVANRFMEKSLPNCSVFLRAKTMNDLRLNANIQKIQKAGMKSVSKILEVDPSPKFSCPQLESKPNSVQSRSSNRKKTAVQSETANEAEQNPQTLSNLGSIEVLQEREVDFEPDNSDTQLEESIGPKIIISSIGIQESMENSLKMSPINSVIKEEKEIRMPKKRESLATRSEEFPLNQLDTRISEYTPKGIDSLINCRLGGHKNSYDRDMKDLMAERVECERSVYVSKSKLTDVQFENQDANKLLPMHQISDQFETKRSDSNSQLQEMNFKKVLIKEKSKDLSSGNKITFNTESIRCSTSSLNDFQEFPETRNSKELFLMHFKEAEQTSAIMKLDSLQTLENEKNSSRIDLLKKQSCSEYKRPDNWVQDLGRLINDPRGMEQIEELVIGRLVEDFLDDGLYKEIFLPGGENVEGIETGMERVEEYVFQFTKYIEESKYKSVVLKNLRRPLGPTTLQKMAFFHDVVEDSNSSSLSFNYQTILPVEIFLDFEQYMKKQKETLQVEEQREALKRIHDKMIFDCLNEALDGKRVLGLKGSPLPVDIITSPLQMKDNPVPRLNFLTGHKQTYSNTQMDNLFSEQRKFLKIKSEGKYQTPGNPGSGGFLFSPQSTNRIIEKETASYQRQKIVSKKCIETIKEKSQVETVFEKTAEQIKKWALFMCGMFQHKPENFKFMPEFVTPMILERLKESRMTLLEMSEMEELDNKMNDYDDEKYEILLSLNEMVMDHLVTDICADFLVMSDPNLPALALPNDFGCVQRNQANALVKVSNNTTVFQSEDALTTMEYFTNLSCSYTNGTVQAMNSKHKNSSQRKDMQLNSNHKNSEEGPGKLPNFKLPMHVSFKKECSNKMRTENDILYQKSSEPTQEFENNNFISDKKLKKLSSEELKRLSDLDRFVNDSGSTDEKQKTKSDNLNRFSSSPKIDICKVIEIQTDIDPFDEEPNKDSGSKIRSEKTKKIEFLEFEKNFDLKNSIKNNIQNEIDYISLNKFDLREEIKNASNFKENIENYTQNSSSYDRALAYKQNNTDRDDVECSSKPSSRIEIIVNKNLSKKIKQLKKINLNPNFKKSLEKDYEDIAKQN